MIDLLNNNKYVFGPNRRPIVQFAVENRQALQLQEQRRERLRAKQELLKNPTNNILAFESNKKKKQSQSNWVEPTKNQVRLSEIIKKEEEEAAAEAEEENTKDVGEKQKRWKSPINDSNVEKMKKRKRSKTKSKREIRDKLDRMIDNVRNKPQLPAKTKKKWFE